MPLNPLKNQQCSIFATILATRLPTEDVNVKDMQLVSGLIACGLGLIGVAACGEQETVGEFNGLALNRCSETEGEPDRGLNQCITISGDNRAWVATRRGIVTKLDVTKSTVTVNHGFAQTMGWPTILTSSFLVRERALFDKLTVAREVEFDFKKEGADFIIIGVRDISDRR